MPTVVLSFNVAKVRLDLKNVDDSIGALRTFLSNVDSRKKRVEKINTAKKIYIFFLHYLCLQKQRALSYFLPFNLHSNGRTGRQ